MADDWAQWAQWNAVFLRVLTEPTSDNEEARANLVDRARATADAAVPGQAARRRDKQLERRRRWARSRPWKGKR